MGLLGNVKNEIILFKALIKSINNQIEKKIKPLNNELISEPNDETLNELTSVFNKKIFNLLIRMEDNFNKIILKVNKLFTLDFENKRLTNVRKHVNITRKIDDFVVEFSRFYKFFQDLSDVILVVDQLFDDNERKNNYNVNEQLELSFSLIKLMINSLKHYIKIIVFDLKTEKVKNI